MSTYSRDMDFVGDRRRAMRLAQRIADGKLDPNGSLMGPPGRVNADAAGFGQLLASGINFDRAGFAYDTATHSNYTVNGSSTSPTSWTKVASRTDNLRLSLGEIDEPVYVWIWGSFSWANSGTGADGRSVGVLYDGLAGSAQGIVRASNVANTRMLADNVFRQLTYIGFIAIDEDILSGAAGNAGTGDQDWNIGLQHQLGGAQQATTQSASRQSLIVFMSAYPPDGDTNYNADSSLD